MTGLVAIALLLGLQTGTQPPATPTRDSTAGNSVNIGIRSHQRKRELIPLTPALLASAFRDPAARTLVTRARAARASQDSLLQSYEATSSQRLSVGARLKSIGRDRLVWRMETARRIQWQRGVGAHVEVLGARQVAPVVSSDIKPAREYPIGAGSIPYFPGREMLWPMGQMTAVSDGGVWIHPLATGAEAYYRYSTGDSIGFTLSDKRTIRLTEIRLTPREPQSDLVTGSFWFDDASGQLVRAIYRPSVPMEMQLSANVDENKSDFGWIGPLSMTVKSVNVEFGLHEGRWWLPRRQAADAEAQVTFARVPVVMEQRFEYASVNALPPLAPIVIDAPVNLGDIPLEQFDSTGRKLTEAERVERRRLARAERDRVVAERCAANGGFFTTNRSVDSVLVAVRIPCDSATLIGSPALPGSIFDTEDDPLTESDVEMLARALGMTSQARWSPTAPRLHYGLDLVRYNRVEGLSVGAAVRQQLGAGFTGQLVGRLGVADLDPRGELLLERSDAWRTFTLGAFERLGVANDWGTPLDFGASLNALLFGRDEGLYYRATGVELGGRGLEGSRFSWRVFGEQHRAVPVETHFSLPHAINGFRFRENIVADRADLLGAAVRLQGSRGIDPEGFRMLADLRGEGATGDFDFARGMLDLTLSRGLFGNYQGSLTGAGGSSRGAVPVQRLWYLGGVHTIRGQPLAAASGDAFWMARGEIGYAAPVVRPSVFYDMGWAGARADWRHPGRPLSGAGIGLSLLDGLMRLDVAKGIRPSRGVRVDLTLEARF
jgi:hypothetical protein